MNIIERIAQALLDEEHRAHDTSLRPLASESPGRQALFRDQATAVVAVLRTPTKAMIAAGGLQTGTQGFPITDQIAEWTWDRMIEAGLAE
jgi:hypothetical protein